MSDFDPDAPVKRSLLDVLAGKHSRVRQAFSDLNEAKCYLTWDATQPEHTLLRTIQYGLAMLKTDCTEEWIVAGSGVFAVMRTMEEFVELGRPELACGLTYAGNIGNMRVYLLPWPAMPAVELMIGHRCDFARCVCTNFPFAFAGDQPPQMNDPNDPHVYGEDNDEECCECEEPALPNPKILYGDGLFDKHLVDRWEDEPPF